MRCPTWVVLAALGAVGCESNEDIARETFSKAHCPLGGVNGVGEKVADIYETVFGKDVDPEPEIKKDPSAISSSRCRLMRMRSSASGDDVTQHGVSAKADS